MFTATWLLHKEILIHHTTWTEVKSRWATIHPQLLVTVVDSTACPPRSVFEVSGWTQCFWVSQPQKFACGVNKSEDRAFTFAREKKKEEKVWFILLWIIKYGALPNCTRHKRGRNHPVKNPQPHKTLSKSQNETGAKTLLRRCYLSHSCRWWRGF